MSDRKFSSHVGPNATTEQEPELVPLPENFPGKFLLDSSAPIKRPGDAKNSDLKQGKSVQKPKKIRPKVKIPESPDQISSNWMNLQKSLGMEDKPRKKRAIPPPKVVESSSTSLVLPKEELPAELPEADASTFVKTKSFSG